MKLNQTNIKTEIIALSLVLVAVLYLLALGSYSHLENPFSGSMNLQKSTNYLGITGSYIADFSLAIFGSASYIFALSLIWIAYLLHNRDFIGFNRWIFVAKFFAFWIVLLAFTGFCNNVISEFSGGWTGLLINQYFTPLLGQGIIIIYLAIIILGFSIISNISIINIILFVYNLIILIATKIIFTIKFIFSKFRKVPNSKITQIKNTTPLSRKKTLKPKLTIEQKNITTGVLPSIDLLDSIKQETTSYNAAKLQQISNQVVEKLADFGFDVEIAKVSQGPVITQFELLLAPGVKVSKIVNLDKDLARALLVESVRVVDVIPGKPVIGLEIPNEKRELISIKEIIASDNYNNSNATLTIALGKNIIGEAIVADLAKTPHLLVAGATGMGKSVGLNAMILGILLKSSPQNVRMLMIDPKIVELAVYADIPHLLTPVVTDMNEAASSLFWCVSEMERRYLLLAKFGVRNIEGFNEKVRNAKTNGEPLLDPDFDEASAMDGDSAKTIEELPLIVIVIDEYADMLGALAQEDRAKSKRTESFIIRLAQKARAAGMHLIIATQRPSVDVITGLIKSNIPSRIAFKVSSKIDSRTILDNSGADQLLGMGDMLFLQPGKAQLTRIHGAFVSDDEIRRVVECLKDNHQTNYVEGILNQVEKIVGENFEVNDINGETDELYDEAVEIVVSTRKASISGVQRRLRIGYNRAARIIESMEAAGVVSSPNSGGNRQVIAQELPK